MVVEQQEAIVEMKDPEEGQAIFEQVKIFQAE
jgi:hypothetical protein